jgi:dipeptidyl aminopeptidase/acylaminoacyl peptidase
MKNNFSKYKFVILVVLLLFIGCGNSSLSNAQLKNTQTTQTDTKTFPALPSAEKVEDGIIVYKVRLNKDDEASNIWIYLPEKQTKEKLPAVLIAAAGSYLFNGVSIGKGDQPEHLPYVRKGYAVIAYETPGSLKEADNKKLTNEQLRKAAAEFKDSNAGLIQEQNALNYALDKVPAIDAERIYSAGHSSAATLSLLVAANEPRVKAAIAYAPATDVEKKLGKDLDFFERQVPGFKNFISQNSPKNDIPKIKIPIFIFQATDDSVIPVEDTNAFVAELKKSNSNVTFVTVNEGDHYDSMIQQGIPRGIEWLNKIAFKDKIK